eukprot:1160859-Pelagomonas_calceolata.AAC.16
MPQPARNKIVSSGEKSSSEIARLLAKSPTTALLLCLALSLSVAVLHLQQKLVSVVRAWDLLKQHTKQPQCLVFHAKQQDGVQQVRRQGTTKESTSRDGDAKGEEYAGTAQVFHAENSRKVYSKCTGRAEQRRAPIWTSCALVAAHAKLLDVLNIGHQCKGTENKRGRTIGGENTPHINKRKADTLAQRVMSLPHQRVRGKLACTILKYPANVLAS